MPKNAIVPGIAEPISNQNGISVSKDGRIYFTSMFSGFHFSEGLIALFAMSDPSGRVFEYNPEDGNVSLLMDK